MGLLRFLLLFLLSVPLAQAETRFFVSLAGSLLQAEITAVVGDTVSLQRSSDQQILIINRSTLCKEDSVYITRWQEQHPDQATAPVPSTEVAAAPVQKFRLACQTLPAKINRGPPDSDHRVFEYTYTFNLSNQEVNRDLQNARGLALTLGKNVADPNGDLIVLQKEEFDITLRAQSKMAYSTKPVRLTYSQDPTVPYGVKNYGYVLIIRDAAGNIQLVEASPAASTKFTKEILSLSSAPSMVDREFRPKSQSGVPQEYISD